jgi:hypothetical protein
MQRNDDPGTLSLQVWNSVFPVENVTEHRQASEVLPLSVRPIKRNLPRNGHD